MMPITNSTHLLALAALISILLAGVTQASQEAADPAAASLTEIKVSFKLDPRITQGMYMGERWVSPATYTSVQKGKNFTVWAKARGLDAQGKQVDINPIWKTGDPAMVNIFPGQGPKVEITVLKEGQSDLVVTSHNISKKLSVKAVHQNGVWQVEVSR